ncbi:hypothetical protein SAMN04487949_3383 [Halogranum gelatinilyticum]|uniref:Uncharacterized protein n=1 Tax=Halogranum gelatinilyticum TaxID=660521 RepID=A0A1G9YMW0_9EURY|nr:hypothetical protein [Halogranum gelatinilyticum]SDN10504.1 hypothetical protein SAMN04487949_3383 [Halogranum gelatinilyticum]
MTLPSRDDFRDPRRTLPVLAALCLLVALAFPMWTISVHAVQYPDTVLRLQLYAYPHIGGDYAEMARLNKYIGFYYPDPVLWGPNYTPEPTAVDVPEWSLGPVAFLGVALSSLVVAFAPDETRLRRGLRWQFAGTVVVFGVLLADIQYRLYQAGHSLDPEAPVMGVSGFTPPLWGKYEVANITSYSRFGLGAYLAMVSVGLLVVAFYYRHESLRFTDLAARLRRAPGALRQRLGSARGHRRDADSAHSGGE